MILCIRKWLLFTSDLTRWEVDCDRAGFTHLCLLILIEYESIDSIIGINPTMFMLGTIQQASIKWYKALLTWVSTVYRLEKIKVYRNIHICEKGKYCQRQLWTEISFIILDICIWPVHNYKDISLFIGTIFRLAWQHSFQLSSVSKAYSCWFGQRQYVLKYQLTELVELRMTLTAFLFTPFPFFYVEYMYLSIQRGWVGCSSCCIYGWIIFCRNGLHFVKWNWQFPNVNNQLKRWIYLVSSKRYSFW